jgi:hypothetical protein
LRDVFGLDNNINNHSYISQSLWDCSALIWRCNSEPAQETGWPSCWN